MYSAWMPGPAGIAALTEDWVLHESSLQTRTVARPAECCASTVSQVTRPQVDAVNVDAGAFWQVYQT